MELHSIEVLFTLLLIKYVVRPSNHLNQASWQAGPVKADGHIRKVSTSIQVDEVSVRYKSDTYTDCLFVKTQ